MFSGIVKGVTSINSFDFDSILKLGVCINEVDDCNIGDSIAINGVCLTITSIDIEQRIVFFDVVTETLNKTNLLSLKNGSQVNYEKSCKLGDYIGGHQVQGHVDGVGQISKIERLDGGDIILEIQLSPDLLKFLVAKGYVTIDGMSITIISVKENSFTVTLIPHTLESTISKYYSLNSSVNIEVDPIGKHIHSYMENYNFK